MSAMHEVGAQAVLQASSILVVDDEPADVRLLLQLLEAEGYINALATTEPQAVLSLARQHDFDLVLLDLHMPGVDGYQVMEQLRGLEAPPAVLVITADLDQGQRLRALQSGARDFLAKPFDRAELLARMRNLLEMQRFQRYLNDQNTELEAQVRAHSQALHDSRLDIIRRLGRAAELRDNETGGHILRMSQYCSILARRAGLGEAVAELILEASPMHDIGKIGIPDRILLKPGTLEPEEWAVMKTHTLIGAELLHGHPDDPLMSMAREIALNHHEKWDGTGYPNGLQGEVIPLTGRIVALADTFDALTSARPYKQPWSAERAIDYIRNQRGQHFDPVLTDCFMASLSEILAVKAYHPDPMPDDPLAQLA